MMVSALFPISNIDRANEIVYHIDTSSAEPVGGIARFKTLCNEYRKGARFNGQPGLLTLFSGDAFNPSLESSVTKGKSSLIPPDLSIRHAEKCDQS